MENNKNLIVICGPTSTGKTSLALNISNKFDGEIISADSRQVYKGMDIGTGKDISRDSKINSEGFYTIDGVKVWGYDLVDPKKEFSVSHFMDFAHKIIDKVSSRGKLPILVGGTGLYIKAVIDGIETAGVPKNNNLRKSLESKTASELYETLSQMDSIKSGSLNASDRHNPRRLIRAIEVAQYHLTKKNLPTHHSIGDEFEILFVGLTAPKSFLNKKIEKRVKDRVVAGIKDEITKLLDSGVNWEDQSMMAIGYRGWRDYFDGDVPEEQIVNEWALDEIKYAKRQMVWFKKDPRIVWFDISKQNYVESVENLVKKWYKLNHAEKS